MCDPTLFHSLIDSCTERELTVDCPARRMKADITIARWKSNDSQLTPWNVVDCSLLPAGQVSCQRDCLADLEEVSS